MSNKYNEKEKAVIDALKSLGRTPNAIAKKLEKLKIKGVMADPDLCPIANYLKQKVKYKLTVDSAAIRDQSKIMAAPQYIDVKPPNAVGDFIVNFDACMYPELDSEVTILEFKDA